MVIKRPQLINNEIYHIVTRGVGDTDIFKYIDDYYRGIFSIYEFNTTEPVEIRRQREKRQAIKSRGELFSADARDMLVEILSFCLMPNHVHLLVRQIKDDGISQFMRKFGAGYVTYFNKKYDRRGHLFQGRFKVVHIKDNEQLKTVFVYVHANPISLIEPKWKEEGINNPEEVIRFLENYKWSSYLDYIGKKSFPSVSKRNFLLNVMEGEEGCKNFVDSWVRYKGEINWVSDMLLE